MKRKTFLKLFGMGSTAITALPSILKQNKPAEQKPITPKENQIHSGTLTGMEYGYEYQVPEDRWEEFREAFEALEQVKVDGELWHIKELTIESEPIDVTWPELDGPYTRYAISGRVSAIAQLYRDTKPDSW